MQKIQLPDTYTSGACYTHGLPQIFTTSDKQRNDHMITHTRDQTPTCIYVQRLKRFITHNFSSQLNRILKTELIQNRNRFRRIQYSEIDMPSVWVWGE